MKTYSKPHQVMIGRSALLSDSLPWSSDKTGRNPCGPVAIRIRQREFWSIRYHEYMFLFHVLADGSSPRVRGTVSVESTQLS